MGVERLCVPSQPQFYTNESAAESFVYGGWVVKGPQLGGGRVEEGGRWEEEGENKNTEATKKQVRDDMRIRWTHCFHEHYMDNYIMKELSVDEFLVCPQQSFICGNNLSLNPLSGMKVKGRKKSEGRNQSRGSENCFQSEGNRRTCQEKCTTINGPPLRSVGDGVAAFHNSTGNPMHFNLRRNIMLAPQGADDRVFGASWALEVGGKLPERGKSMCNPRWAYGGGAHVCDLERPRRFDDHNNAIPIQRQIKDGRQITHYYGQRCYIHHLVTSGTSMNGIKGKPLLPTPAAGLEARLIWQRLVDKFLSQHAERPGMISSIVFDDWVAQNLEAN